MGPETKTLLGSSGIENRITSTVLAAYSQGRLYRTEYYTGNGASMSFILERGVSYTVYAMVNMGDTRSSFPQYETNVPDITYTLPSYDSVNLTGMPMAGSAMASGTASCAIPVKRLLAKVTANIECDWPGASISGGVIGNMNAALKPFGQSTLTETSDRFAYTPESHQANGGSSATLVFYVPENMQGTVSGITSAWEKTHDGNAAVTAMKDRLSYLEISVSGSGLYDGEITYRSYLGGNSTDNFDIKRNTSYTWNLSYSEDNLYRNEWKAENALEDHRQLAIHGPIYIVPGEIVNVSSYVDTNMDYDTVGWQISPNRKGRDIVGSIWDGQDIDGDSFKADDAYSPFNYGNRHLSVFPHSNPRSGLGGGVPLYVVDESIGWMNTLQDKYFVGPGKSLKADVCFSVSYTDDSDNSRVDINLKGKGGDRWTYTKMPGTGISSTLLGDTGREYDQVEYSVRRTALPGDYSLTARTVDGSSSSAFLHVNDTRTIKWNDRSSKVPTSEGFIAYRLLSDNKIAVLLDEGSKYATASGAGFTSANSPFSFTAGDRSGRIADISPASLGVPFEGAVLNNGNYTDRIGVSYDGNLYTKSMSGETLSGKTFSGRLTLLTGVSSDLADGSSSRITVSAKNAYDDNTTHSIEAVVHVGNGWLRELALTPAISRVTVGTTISFTPTFYNFRVTDGSLTTNSSQILQVDNAYLVWTGAPNGVFTADYPGNYRIYACFRGTYLAYADIEVTANDVDVSGDWESGDPIILD
ncbi:MAG: DUF4906 domain-containing protein [Bacteroidales bacterium]|nr:DUF4906 domain-containing protein [Bacteroidales bacterium]